MLHQSAGHVVRTIPIRFRIGLTTIECFPVQPLEPGRLWSILSQRPGVSDKPLHGEIKLPGTANAFYQRAVGEHLRIGIAALDLLRGDLGALHSRKLRSFDEPPFR